MLSKTILAFYQPLRSSSSMASAVNLRRLTTKSGLQDKSKKWSSSASNLSDIGNDIFEDLFRSRDSESMYSQWADTYEHDMNSLKFDSILRAPELIEQLVGNENESECEDSVAIASQEVIDLSSEEKLILDIGCGTGLLGEKLQETALIECEVNIDGMDLTQEMLDILESNRSELYNEVLKHDITDDPWPFDDNRYDVSVCNGVLVYVKDKGRCLEEFIRVTKPGGYCLLMLRHDSLPEFSSKIYELLTDQKWRLQQITETRFNFHCEKTNTSFVPYNHHIFEIL